MKITVAKEHIAAGVPYKGDSCPIALAISDQLMVQPFVNRYNIWFPDYDWYGVGVSEKLTQFMHDFDRGLPVKPFSFELRLPK